MSLTDNTEITVFWSDLEGKVVKYLTDHRLLRLVVGDLGMLLFTVGVFLVGLWDAPLIEGVEGKAVLFPILVSGYFCLRVWRLSKAGSSLHDRILRYMMLTISIIPLVVGVVAWFLLFVPIVHAGESTHIAAFAAGFTGLAIWHLSGKHSIIGPTRDVSLTGELMTLKKMHDACELSDHEYSKAKLKLLE